MSMNPAPYGNGNTLTTPQAEKHYQEFCDSMWKDEESISGNYNDYCGECFCDIKGKGLYYCAPCTKKMLGILSS